MLKVVSVTLALLVPATHHAFAEPLDGKPVPLFPNLSWGLSEDAARSKGLKNYIGAGGKTDVIGLPSVAIGDLDFSVQASFGKKDIGEVRSGLNYMLLRHEGYVAKGKYEKFIRSITNGFLYAGKSSDVRYSASFYNAVAKNGYLVVMTSDGQKLSIAIAPGRSK